MQLLSCSDRDRVPPELYPLLNYFGRINDSSICSKDSDYLEEGTGSLAILRVLVGCEQGPCPSLLSGYTRRSTKGQDSETGQLEREVLHLVSHLGRADIDPAM